MNKQKVLEAAAKAADYTLSRHAQDEWKFTLGGKEWNPLKSNEDAFRLLADLRICLAMDEKLGGGVTGVEAWCLREEVWYVYDAQVPYSGDTAADIRKAITLCAAKIGGYSK